jgi:hypothetical protein
VYVHPEGQGVAFATAGRGSRISVTPAKANAKVSAETRPALNFLRLASVGFENIE